VHEMTITASLVEAVLDLAKKAEAKRVVEVHLRIGKLRVLSIDQVKFSYEILTKGTLLDGSRLIIKETPGKVRCTVCSYGGEFDPEADPAYHFGLPPLVCPNCGNLLEVEGGDECVITKVRMLAPTEPQQQVKT
jgi:hydrogenase nickel incorporation protein HypA/HybF